MGAELERALERVAGETGLDIALLMQMLQDETEMPPEAIRRCWDIPAWRDAAKAAPNQGAEKGERA